ncbi:methyltransferase type 11 [Roseibium porphyridii]|uniref:Methyltransferase type 11 n=1 Tax=Roseibium porphyridii TaxID=2866279 RepID=A0ABY8F7N6_9HYPH|nr:methyltransferase type 11 [Roseibium sp. KMA01]WFE89865.1 methyltransferase type 11 [Roseibium sp. KMA01]
MKKSVYARPNKPMFIPVQYRSPGATPKRTQIDEPLIIDKASECHITPADVAHRMVGYLGPTGDYNTLEPSAGTGALVSALLASGHSPSGITAIERHHKLAAKVATLGVPVIQSCFLDYAEEAKGKAAFPRILMNPPFSDVRKHIRGALSLLGRNAHAEPATLVALVPITYNHEEADTLETLPIDTFSSCRVHTKIIRFKTSKD